MDIFYSTVIPFKAYKTLPSDARENKKKAMKIHGTACVKQINLYE